MVMPMLPATTQWCFVTWHRIVFVQWTSTFFTV